MRTTFSAMRRGSLAIETPQTLRRKLCFQVRPLAAAVLLLIHMTTTSAHHVNLGSYQSIIADAAHRFAIPTHWISAIIDAESSGDPFAVSRNGAMGLMQIMPETWEELRDQFDLGPDPFAPADNILAGTAYLRQMLDRYGSIALMLAAYNAGPGRVDEHLATGRALPRETVDYVAKLLPELSSEHNLTTFAMPPNGAGDPSTPTIFVPISRSFYASSERSSERISPAGPTMQPHRSVPLMPNGAVSGHELFVQPNTQPRR